MDNLRLRIVSFPSDVSQESEDCKEHGEIDDCLTNSSPMPSSGLEVSHI